MKKLVLIDGHAILHRAFHALPPHFFAPDGTATNAVHGFTNMMLRVVTDLKPDYLAVAFDLPTPNFRQQMYSAYQDKRPEMVGNLKEQIPLVMELLEAGNIPHFEVAGYEADDVLGTLATEATKNGGIETVIVTGDRDMLQLVNPTVKVCVPVKGLAETKTYDEKLITAEFGVVPSQWVDVKALKGDGSDNYPGVRGIGPKTAQLLIAKYGTLEALYAHLGQLEEKVATKLAEGAEGAGMAKKLATIVCDVPLVKLDLDHLSIETIDWAGMAKYMRERLGFKSTPEKIEKTYLSAKEPEGADKKKATKEKKTEEQISLL